MASIFILFFTVLVILLIISFLYISVKNISREKEIGSLRAITFSLIASIVITLLIYSSYSYNFKVSIDNQINNKEYLLYSKPLYTKVKIDGDNLKTFKEVLYLNEDSYKKGLTIESKDLNAFKTGKFRIGKQKNILINILYDEYFKVLKRYAENIGGSLKVDKEIEYYIKNTQLIPIEENSFNSEKEAKEAIDKAMKDELIYNDIRVDMANKIKEEDRQREYKNISFCVRYSYELSVPEKYYNYLRKYRDSISNKDYDFLSYDTLLPIIFIDKVSKNPTQMFFGEVNVK